MNKALLVAPLCVLPVSKSKLVGFKEIRRQDPGFGVVVVITYSIMRQEGELREALYGREIRKSRRWYCHHWR